MSIRLRSRCPTRRQRPCSLTCRTGRFRRPGRTQLQHIADLKRQIVSASQQLEQAEAQIAEIVRDQDRIRQNLVSLNSVSGQQEQVQKYSRQLADQEAELAKLRDGKGAIEKKRVGLQQELDSAVERLEF